MARNREFDTTKALVDIGNTFWAHGYEATGVSDLVDATGVGRASLYAAFGSKQEMLHLAVEHYLDTNIEEQWSRVDGQGLSGVTAMFRRFAMAREARPERAQWGCLMVNSIVELGRADPVIVELGERYRSRIRRAFRTALETAVESGEIAPGNIDAQVELATMMILGCFVAIKGGADLEEVQVLTGTATDLIESWRITT